MSNHAAAAPDAGRELDTAGNRASMATAEQDITDGIGSALSSSNSSIMGDEMEADAGTEWGPLHPCFPHLNPHVPLDSAAYARTRIIRIRRDWLIEGDLAPTFSNMYPEILAPAGLSEPEFRSIIQHVNTSLIDAFNPLGFRNVVDSIMGAATGWLWDDLGLSAIKGRLQGVEHWIEEWNSKTERNFPAGWGVSLPPKIISLRQTGYMTVSCFRRIAAMTEANWCPAGYSNTGSRGRKSSS